jgi:N-ethylmaleimide reductase
VTPFDRILGPVEVMSTAGEDEAARPLPANHMLLRHGRLGALQLANRILMAPMARTRAAFEGTPSELMAEYYAQRASSGLIISEGTFPSAIGRTYLKQPGLHSDAHQTGWARVTDKVHAAGGRILVQLQHSGRISHPDILFGLTPVAPSVVRPEGMVHTADGKKPFVEPRALGSDEVHNLAAEFSCAARRARSAGADGVELHAANGYLLAQFLSPTTNHRTDAYGGSAEKRARIVVEVACATAAEIGADRVGVRISPGNSENDIHDHDDETYVVLASRLRALGLAYLHVRATPQQEILGRLRRLWPDGLILNQGFGTEPTTREQAAEVLESGLADAVTIGRRLLANPDLVRRWTEGADLNEIRPAFLYCGGAQGYTDYPVLPWGDADGRA